MKFNKVAIRMLFLFYCSTLAPSCNHAHKKEHLSGEIKQQKQSGNTSNLIEQIPFNKTISVAKPNNEFAIEKSIKNDDAQTKNN